VDTGCIDESTVVAFLAGDLPAVARSRVEDHVASCDACRELTTWAAADIVHASRPFAGDAKNFIGQIAPGSRIDRYQVLGAIGRGAMGEVYAAYHPDLDRRIALKVVSESGAHAPERRARLLREARAIARLSHPNVVAVHDAGTFGDRVYIAMEFIAGETMDVWLRSKQRTVGEITDVFVAAGRGLAAAHAAGIIHRDFKPQNVMVGKDGSVRVMDFGLARLAEEPVETTDPDAGSDDDVSPQPATVTKTGALVGTLAYMAPEQFRHEPPDARADQFSFCVAFHEALHGQRPALSHLKATVAAADGETSGAARPSGAPAWLRAVIARGLSHDRDRRFRSMDALLAAIARGRTRIRRAVWTLAAVVTMALLTAGAWRLGAARRVSCAVPPDRLAGAWTPGVDKDPRHQAIHRAFRATGRPNAETSWQRVSKVLDAYIGQWSAMYTETCEATHVRGEQSAEVLDLRMSCLGENLDQVRALTDVLMSADEAAVSRAVAGAQSLTSVARCADVRLLRLAVPPPRDDATMKAVQELRRSMNDVQALWGVGTNRESLRRAVALRPRVESVGYKPLLAELLELIGALESEVEGDAVKAESTLLDAVFTAESIRDDITAARAASHLIFIVGVRLGRYREAAVWLRFANAALDRAGAGHERIRAWVLNNHACVLEAQGDLEGAKELVEQAIAMKERAVGKNTPDVAVSVNNLSFLLNDLRRHQEALAAASRAIDILKQNGDPDSQTLAVSYGHEGRALLALGRPGEAEAAFAESIRIFRANLAWQGPDFAEELQGLGEAEIVQGRPANAISPLEESLKIWEKVQRRPSQVADARFALARALWESGRNRPRALSLAEAARVDLASPATAARQRVVAGWLTDHDKRAHPLP
jgi:tetratricopeptide (TPR) repeat protein